MNADLVCWPPTHTSIAFTLIIRDLAKNPICECGDSIFFDLYMQDVDPTTPRCSVIRDLRRSVCNLAFLENPNGYIGGLSQVHMQLCNKGSLAVHCESMSLFMNSGRFNT